MEIEKITKNLFTRDFKTLKNAKTAKELDKICLKIIPQIHEIKNFDEILFNEFEHYFYQLKITAGRKIYLQK